MQLNAVVTTSALELGVDIGSLDAVVMLGHPGKTSSLWQQVRRVGGARACVWPAAQHLTNQTPSWPVQAGRAGRGQRDALVVLVAYNSPVDQFYARNPAKLFEGDPEVALRHGGGYRHVREP